MSRQSIWLAFMTARNLRWLGWASMAVVFNQHFYTIKVVSGRSMQPTLNPDTSPWRDVLLFDRTVGGQRHKCKRGDIVAFKSPLDPKEIFVKRIVALEGDEVETLHPYPDQIIKVPEGHMWVEGDERFHTRDSNSFGPIPLALLDSKTSFILWPLSRFGKIHTPSTRVLAHYPAYSATWKQERDAIDHERRRTQRVRVGDR